MKPKKVMINNIYHHTIFSLSRILCQNPLRFVKKLCGGARSKKSDDKCYLSSQLTGIEGKERSALFPLK